MSSFQSSYRLHKPLAAPVEILQRVERDYERFASTEDNRDLTTYIRDNYDLDLTTEYGGEPIANPWGKASGQLSMTSGQVQEDVDAGLGFVVLKTVIAQDELGGRTMQAWAVKEARMALETIEGIGGQQGWTVSWKGRGWWGTFEEYLELIRDARRISHSALNSQNDRAQLPTVIVPSVKYHLPTPDETIWREEEYRWTTREILRAWRSESSVNDVMPIEKDFSPTLAGSDRASAQEKIVEWLTVVPRLIRDAVADFSPTDGTALPIRVGMKMFNALFDDEFQVRMLNVIHRAEENARPDYFIYGNRLFDPQREFDGHRGIAYGGPDLSQRNLRVLDLFLGQETVKSSLGSETGAMLPLSATGDIHSGRMALEYALRGASSFQLHTFFQHASDFYRRKTGNRTQKALHELYFHPRHGFIVWMHDLAAKLNLPRSPLRFRDVVGQIDRLPQ